MTHIATDSSFTPLLDEDPLGKGWVRVPFDTWWNERVIRDKHHANFSRKDITLWLANKEGGAHTDPTLDEKYRRLQEENSFGWFSESETRQPQGIEGVELACMRQITHELIRTIEKNGRILGRHLS